MFTHTCSHCAKRQLIFPSQISAVTNTEAGIVVAFTCWCGETEAVLTGRRATKRSDVVRAA